MSRTHTLGSRVVAWVTASLLVIAPSSCTPQPTDDGSEHDAIEFRVGEPNPGALAGAVGFFRTLPVVLAPTSPFGTLPGSADVDASGAAHYSIPIEATPGPRGMQPRIAVSYNSNGDGGSVGHRFDLVGLSAIVRCTGNEADDGRYSPIRFKDSDPLCLDGDRLVLAAGSHAMAGAEYRTASDPFARIVLDNDLSQFGGTFTVHTREGQVLRYGTTPASLWVGSTSGTLIPWHWGILRACDRWSNCVEYEYEHGPDVGNGPTDQRIKAIRYGGTADPASRRAVTFAWIDRPDVVTRYLFGAELRREKLLDRVSVLGPNAAPIRSYRFEYQFQGQTGRSRLESARLCDAAGVCLPATEFNWSPDADTTLVPGVAWDSDGLADEQEAFLRAHDTLAGNFDGLDGDELLFRSDDPGAPWLMWFGATDGATLPTVAFPPFDNILPGRVPSGSGAGDFDDISGYLDYLDDLSPEFTMSVVDFNGDVRDDVLIPVRGGWPGDGGLDDDGVPYAQQFMIAANQDGSHFSTLYIDDGSDDPIYQMVPVDHDGDMFTDVWMCRGPSSVASTWVLAHHRGGAVAEFGFDFLDTGIGCSAFDEYTVSSVDGGPAHLLVIPAHTSEGELIPSADRDDYRRLRFDTDSHVASLDSVGLPRDRYQRMHDRSCRNAAMEAYGRGPTSTSGPGFDRHIDLNDDGFADVLRFELASGDAVENPAVGDGMITAGGLIAGELEEADWSTVSLCGNDLSLAHDAVLAVYFNTGAGYIRGPDALTLDGNAHAQFWLNVAGATAFDLEDDGRLDLLLPATGPDTGWTQLEVDADGTFQTRTIPGGEGWPAYADDDTWRENLELASHVRVMNLGNPEGERPSLVFAGAIEDAPAYPLWVNIRMIKGEDAVARVESIVDGLGAVTEFDYKAVYEPVSPAAQWPKAPLRAAVWVTSAMRESITTRGVDKTPDTHAMRTRTYDYRDAAVDRRGRGFLGFGRVQTQQVDPNGSESIVTLTTYDQTYNASVDNYPARGRAVEREVYTRVGQEQHIDRELWTWNVRERPEAGGMTHFAYAGTHREMALQVAVDACAPDGWCTYYDDPSQLYRDTTTTESRDDFGTLVTSVQSVDAGDGPVTQVDQTQIVHDTANWLLGQVGRVAVQTCAAGQCGARVTETQYDPSTGAVVEVTLQPGDPDLELVSAFEHDAHGNVRLVSQTAPDGTPEGMTRTSATQWDDEGVFPLIQGNPLGQAAYVVYDPKSGALVASVDPAGLTTKTSYDGLYRPVTAALHSSPMGGNDGAPTTTEYLPADPAVVGSALVVRSTTAGGQRVSEFFSPAGDLLERRWQGMAVLPAGNPDTVPAGADVYERYGYDRFGRNDSRSVPQWLGAKPDGWHERALDRLDRVAATKAPDGTLLESYDYRPLGQNNAVVVDVRSSQLGAKLLRSTWLDARGLPTREVNADGVSTCFTHGPFDVVLAVERNCIGGGTRLVSSAEYDAMGHTVVQSDPHMGSRTSAWNGFGELVEHIDGALHTTRYEYDPLGRLITRVEPEGSASFVYDTERYGALESDTSPDGVTRYFDVDAFGRTSRSTTVVTTPSGNDVYRFEWTYGAGGRVDQVSYPTPDNEPSMVLRNVYDLAGYLRIVKDQASGAARWSLYTANPSAKPTAEIYGDGTKTTRTYDDKRLWTTRIVHAKPGETLSDLGYEWWPEGELRTRSDAKFVQSESFNYDKQWRVTGSTVSNAASPTLRKFEYDVFGNLTSMTGTGAYVYDASARLTSVGGALIVHDGAGNIQSHGTKTFTHTTFGKVKSVTQGGLTLSMLYDAAGERVRRHQNDTQLHVVTLGSLYERRVTKNGATAATTWRIAAGDRVVGQVVRTKNAVGPGYTSSDQYLHDDELGSTVVVTAASVGGAVTVARASNDAWGRGRTADNWAKWQTDAEAGAVGIGFTGHRAELDHGLIDAGGRMYDPKIGRFTSPDPLVMEPYTGAAYNRYAYVGNRPLRFTDPSGWAATDDGDDGGLFGDAGDQLEETLDRLVGEFDARVGGALGNAYYEVGSFIADADAGDLWTAYDVGVVGPALWVASKGQAHLEALVDTAVFIADNPAAAAVALGAEVVAQTETVVTAHADIAAALGDGDYSKAASVWLNASKAAYGLASLVAGGGGAKLGSMGARSTSIVGKAAATAARAAEDYASKTLKWLKSSGVYVNTHASGKVYVGKGGWMRSQMSAKRIASSKNDPFVSTKWTWMKNSREALKEESRILKGYGGPRDMNNYNMIDSPGTKYIWQDGGL